MNQETTLDLDVACRDRTVSVNHATDRIVVTPGTIDVCSGYTVTFKIEPPVNVGSARTKDNTVNSPSAPWLNAGNVETDAITVKVPPETELKTYKYDIEIDGVGSLDPYFRVIK